MNAPDTQLTRGSAFEGMFVRALQPSGAFAEALRKAGYDAARPPLAEYPSSVWRACIEVARQHTFPSLPAAEGARRLGHLFAEGFLGTITGKLLSATAPIIGPDVVLQRLARSWASTQPSMRVSTQRVADGHWNVTLEGVEVLPDFNAGLLEALLARTRVKPSVTVAEATRGRVVLATRW